MVSVSFTPEEYDLMEKWFGLLFAGETPCAEVGDDDRDLVKKIAMLHLAEVENDNRLRNILKDED
jgi:hypothetical protein